MPAAPLPPQEIRLQARAKRSHFKLQKHVVSRAPWVAIAIIYASLPLALLLTTIRAQSLAELVLYVGFLSMFFVALLAVFGAYIILGVITPPPTPLAERNIAAQTMAWFARWMSAAMAMVVSVLIGLQISERPEEFLQATGEILIAALMLGSIAASLGLAVRLRLCSKVHRRTAWLQSWWSTTQSQAGWLHRWALLAARSWASSPWTIAALYLAPVFLFALGLTAWETFSH